MTEELLEELRLNMQDDIRKEVREIEEQKRRGLNLIIFNLPESKSEATKLRKEYNENKFKKLCESMGLKYSDVKVMFILGNWNKEKKRGHSL